MPDQEIKIAQVDISAEQISELQKKLDELYAKVAQLMDELEERDLLVDSGGGKEVVAYNAEVYADTDHPAYVYFRIDEEMTKVNNIYVDVYPVDYRSPVTLIPWS